MGLVSHAQFIFNIFLYLFLFLFFITHDRNLNICYAKSDS